MGARKKKPDAFAQFDQRKHHLALREVELCRDLLAVYRYALDNVAAPPRNDRDLCKAVKRHADSALRDLLDECPSCGESCCEHVEDKATLREVIDACEHVLDEMEPRP